MQPSRGLMSRDRAHPLKKFVSTADYNRHGKSVPELQYKVKQCTLRPFRHRLLRRPMAERISRRLHHSGPVATGKPGMQKSRAFDMAALSGIAASQRYLSNKMTGDPL